MVLIDKEIKAIAAILVEGGLGASHTAKDDQIQPSSIDLCIGSIFVPGEKEIDGQLKSRSNYALPQGETAIIESKEWLTLPTNIAAMGFPPAHVSGEGLLMTNPGHIDPGYSGRLRFTVINMGKETYPLAMGTPIVTLLLFKLDTPPDASWGARGHSVPDRKSAQDPNLKERLDRLSRDFLSVTDRATNVAKEESKKIGVWVTVTVAIIAAISGLSGALLNYVGVSKSDFEKLSDKVKVLEAKGDVNQLKSRVDLLEKAIANPSTTSKPIPAIGPVK